MRNPIRLLSLAMEAEGVRLRHRTRRIVIRVVLGFVAMALLMGAFVCAHIAGWYCFRQTLLAYQVALILMGADLLVAIILAVIATRSVPSPIEREALALRRRALTDAAASVSFMNLAVQLLEQVMIFRRKP